MSTSIVQSLHLYPIKSTAGISVSHAWIDDFGLSFDRRFVLTALNGQFITARTQPTICLIQCHITSEGLLLTAPNMTELLIETARFSEQYHQVTVWDDQINALYCHQMYDKWFSDYLGMPCQLHFFADKSSRRVKNSDKQVGFADGYPLLLISQASLDDLNQKLQSNNSDNTAVSMTQFRPNIVVNNTRAFEEDTWQRIRIGEVEFDVVKPCSRCIFTTINPTNAEKHHAQEPLTTLKSYRKVASGDVMFGQNLIPLNKGSIKASDPITVISKQAPPTFIIESAKNDENISSDTINAQEALNATTQETKKVISKKAKLTFASWNKEHKGNTQETILEQGEEAGLILPYSCRGGMCGRCRIKLESGEVKQLAVDGLSDEDIKEGYVLACSTIPQSDVILSSGK